VTQRAGDGPNPAGTGPWIAFTVCSVIWSSTFLAIRIGNESLPPLWAASMRLLVAAVLLAAIAALTRQPWPRGPALRAAIAFGVVDFGISLSLLYWAEMRVASSVAAILYATIPLCTALFARAFGLETLRPLKVAGSVVGLGGVIVLFSSQLSTSLPPLPLAAAFLGAVTAALAGVLLKRAPGSSPVAMNAIAHLAGAPLCLAASFALREPHALPQTQGGWLSLSYLVVVGSIVAFVSFTYLVQHWPVVRTSFIAIVVPVLATLLGAWVGHERLGPTTLAGAGIVVAGVTLGIAGDRFAAGRG
jgi:drug/metabolite transporter (DMT)-like permease